MQCRAACAHIKYLSSSATWKAVIMRCSEPICTVSVIYCEYSVVKAVVFLGGPADVVFTALPLYKQAATIQLSC